MLWDFLNFWTWQSLVLRPPREMHLCRSSSNVPRLPTFLTLLQNPHVLLTFGKVQDPLRETTSERAKVARPWFVLSILTSKCGSRHNGVHFFNLSTSKSAPTLKCVLHFDFDLCFAQQRRAFFQHHTFQSAPGMVCFLMFFTFWLPNVLRSAKAYTFSTSQLPKVFRR